MKFIACSTIAALLGAACAAPVAAQVATSPWPVLFHQDLARVAQIEWQLRSAAGTSCPYQGSDAGLVFDDRRAYGKADWALLESAIGLREHPVIAAVVRDGPASRAGLRYGDEVISIGGASIDALIAKRAAGPLVADAMVEEIAAQPPGSDIEIVVRRNGADLTLPVRAVSHCAARLVLQIDKSVDAHSDSRNVAISTGAVAFARTDDELALIAGHELAHVIARDRRGGGISARRRMEDSADRLGMQLAECAGYRREAAVSVFERLGKRDWLGFLRAPTHRSWSARVAAMRAQPPPDACPYTSQ